MRDTGGWRQRDRDRWRELKRDRNGQTDRQGKIQMRDRDIWREMETNVERDRDLRKGRD